MTEKSCSEERIEVAVQQNPSDSITSFTMIVKNEWIASLPLAMTEKVGKQYFVYIMTNKNDAVLYTGITNNLKRRVYEHKEKLIGGFTKRYNINKLVYYEMFEEISLAISREKQIKGGSRLKKIELIKRINIRMEGFIRGIIRNA